MSNQSTLTLFHVINRGFIDRILAQLANAGINLSELDRQPPVSSTHMHPRSCPGAMFWWKMGAPYRTYPFTLHDPSSPVDPGYILLSVSHDPSQIRVRATRCMGTLLEREISCQQCLESRVFVDFVQDYASRHPGKRELRTLSHWQCTQKFAILETTAKNERLDVRFIILLRGQ